MEAASDVHCSYCKARACLWLSTKKSCRSSCLTDFFHRRLGAQCKDCGFCKYKTVKSSTLALVPPGSHTCFSGVKDDALYETCESFCSPQHMKDHCKLCKVQFASSYPKKAQLSISYPDSILTCLSSLNTQCKGCHMCSATCESGIPGDVHYQACSSACDPSLAPAVCSLCRCRSCSFCDGGGTSLALPAPPSNTSNCVPFNGKDIDHRECQSHCSVANKASHCETCKCKVRFLSVLKPALRFFRCSTMVTL